MTEESTRLLRERAEALLTLHRAPSQFAVHAHLLSTGRAMTVKDLSEELTLTPKATERAVAKLLEKGLIQRAPFRDGAYSCDGRQLLLSLLMAASDIYEGLKDRVGREAKGGGPPSS